MGFVAIAGVLLATLGAEARGEGADAILSAAGAAGGLVVHVGCGDGKLTAALAASDTFLVHGLDRDAGNIAKAREHLRSRKLAPTWPSLRSCHATRERSRPRGYLMPLS